MNNFSFKIEHNLKQHVHTNSAVTTISQSKIMILFQNCHIKHKTNLQLNLMRCLFEFLNTYTGSRQILKYTQ